MRKYKVWNFILEHTGPEMGELSNSDGRLNHVHALDSLSANSDCACAFKDEKVKGRGRKEGVEG